MLVKWFVGQSGKSKTHVLLAHHDEDFRLMINVENCLKKNGFVVSVNKQEQLTNDSIGTKNRNHVQSIQKIFDAVSDYYNNFLYLSYICIYTNLWMPCVSRQDVKAIINW